jgi:hypothetical protein
MARVETRHQRLQGNLSLIGVVAHRSVVEEVVVRKNPVAPVAYCAKLVLVGEGSHNGCEVSEITFSNRLCLGFRKFTSACSGQVLDYSSLLKETTIPAHCIFRFDSRPDIMRVEIWDLLQEAHEEFGVANRYSRRSEHCNEAIRARRKSTQKAGVNVIYWVP